MKPRTVWTVLWSCFLVSVNLFFAVAIFVALVYGLRSWDTGMRICSSTTETD